MVKKISVLALAGMLAMPTLTMAAGDSKVADLEKKIEELSRQLDELRGEMATQAKQNEALAENVEDLEDNYDEIDEKSEEWDLAARFKWSGDFRARGDYYSADTVFGRDLDNDTLLTNRLRLNMRVKATENVEFKGRLVMYKTWGDQSAWADDGGVIYPVFDGNVARTPLESSALWVDRAFVNWNNIGGLPVWFSVGRRPTTDGPPAQIRMGVDERLATPMAFMDWPFDGISTGYAWNWGPEAMGDSRIRFCYGRGFEAGLLNTNVNTIDDMDFAGFSWDIMKKGPRFAYIQSFMAFNVINYPNFQDPIINQAFGELSGIGPRRNLGDIWHTAGVYQDKFMDLNYFLAGGWSQTQPFNSAGMFNDPFSPFGPNTSDEDGYSVYMGVRYDLEKWKFGAEWNYGSQYWLAMAPGNDDIYEAKLAARGNVFELYTIWDLPTGEAISKYAKTFVRLGWQHYEYDYSGSFGDWNLYPYDLSDTSDKIKLGMLGQDPVESADQVYVTFEAWF